MEGVQVQGCGSIVVGERRNNGTDEHRTNMAPCQTNITERPVDMEYRTNMNDHLTNKMEHRKKYNVPPNKHHDHRKNMTKSWE